MHPLDATEPPLYPVTLEIQDCLEQNAKQLFPRVVEIVRNDSRHISSAPCDFISVIDKTCFTCSSEDIGFTLAVYDCGVRATVPYSDKRRIKCIKFDDYGSVMDLVQAAVEYANQTRQKYYKGVFIKITKRKTARMKIHVPKFSTFTFSNSSAPLYIMGQGSIGGTSNLTLTP